MKNLAIAFVCVIIAVHAAFAESSSPHYQQVAKYSLPGDGFWDLLTYDPATNRVFIAHNDTILAVDAATGKPAGTLPANGAHGIAVIPDQHLGFSTNGRAGTVTVFDTQSLKPRTDIKAGTNPDAIIYDEHSKHVIVTNGGSKDLTIIDPAALKVVATVPLNGKPELPAADATHVYVNLEDTSEIVSVDPKTWKVEQRWKIAPCEEPTGLAIDESAGRLFAACGGNKQMVVVDTKTGKVVASIPTGAGTDGAAYDPELKLAFAPNGRDGNLTVVRGGKDGKYEAAENVATQLGARTIALDPKSHKVFLPTAEFGPPVAGQQRPSIKPGSFALLVYAPK